MDQTCVLDGTAGRFTKVSVRCDHGAAGAPGMGGVPALDYSAVACQTCDHEGETSMDSLLATLLGGICQYVYNPTDAGLPSLGNPAAKIFHEASALPTSFAGILRYPDKTVLAFQGTITNQSVQSVKDWLENFPRGARSRAGFAGLGSRWFRRPTETHLRRPIGGLERRLHTAAVRHGAQSRRGRRGPGNESAATVWPHRERNLYVCRATPR